MKAMPEETRAQALARVDVSRGAALLDKHKPAWFLDTDPDKVDVMSAAHCPLGQNFGHYNLGKRALGNMSDMEASDYGFFMVDFNSHEINCAWTAEINRRREEYRTKGEEAYFATHAAA